jgi:hypothetical protein
MTGEMDTSDNPDNWRDDLADLIREKKAERELLKKIRESDILSEHSADPAFSSDNTLICTVSQFLK